jgi:hypothetical protein
LGYECARKCFATRAEDGCDLCCGGLADPSVDVSVEVDGVAQAVGDLEVDSGVEGQAGVRVAKVVQADQEAVDVVTRPCSIVSSWDCRPRSRLSDASACRDVRNGQLAKAIPMALEVPTDRSLDGVDAK